MTEAEREREAVVAWLRQRASEATAFDISDQRGRRLRTPVSDALDAAADAISRDNHLQGKE